MDRINDDCLAEIFRNLPLIHRVRIERVCSHWFAVSRYILPWHSRRLDFDNDIGYGPFHHHDIGELIEKIFERNRTYLKEIFFHSRPIAELHQVDNMLSLVGTHCPHITHLHLNSLHLHIRDLVNLIDKCNMIESLSFGYHPENNGAEMILIESAIMAIIKNNTRLRRLSLCRTDWFIGFGLWYMTPNVLESLVIKDHPTFQLSPQAAPLFTESLKELKIWDCHYLTATYIPRFTNLQRLTLMIRQRIDASTIVENCRKLEYVKIALGYAVDRYLHNYEIRPYLDLPLLRTFILRGRIIITEAYFEDKELYNLEDLMLPCCTLNMRNYQRLIQKLPSIGRLQVCECVTSPNSQLTFYMGERRVSVSTINCASSIVPANDDV